MDMQPFIRSALESIGKHLCLLLDQSEKEEQKAVEIRQQADDLQKLSVARQTQLKKLIGIIRAILVGEPNDKTLQYHKATQQPNNLLLESDIVKNIRKRIDGRWEYRKMVNGQKISIIKGSQKLLLQAVRTIEKTTKYSLPEKHTLYHIGIEWYNLFKKDKISTDKVYRRVVYEFLDKPEFHVDIRKITLDQLQQYVNHLSQIHGPAKYVYLALKNIFKFSLQNDYVKKDIGQFLVGPKKQESTGGWFNIEQQQLILDNLHKSEMGHEILFYLLSGARRTEAYSTKLFADKNMLFIEGSKTKSAKRWVKISEDYKNILVEHWPNMFQKKSNFYNRKFKEFMDRLGIKNRSIHDLRHTFNSNLYYLGCPDKERQYYMGHSSIQMTQDIYTHLDLSVSAEDIRKLYNNLYPKF